MTSLFTELMYKMLLLFMSFSLLFGGAKVPSEDDPIRSLSQDVRLTAVLWGDPQISDYMPARQKNTEAACKDAANADERIDALVIAGDLAENGKPAEYKLLTDDLALIGSVDHILPAFGNHDVRLRPFGGTVRKFAEFCSAVNPGLQPDRLYYSYQINGYTFIVLGTVSSKFEEADIDKEELSWFENELDKACEGGDPVFVIVHQPLKLTNGLPDAWNSPFDWAGSVGDQSDDLKAIMNAHKNVFLITGHLHSGLGEANFEDVGGTVSVNLPSVGIVSKDGGYEAAGTGYMMEVYADKVVFRARDFANGHYLSEYDRIFALN